MKNGIYNESYLKALNELTNAKDKYLNKFGKTSLERVILGNPRSRDVEDILKTVKKIEKAIRDNIAFDQVPEHIWKQMIF